MVETGMSTLPQSRPLTPQSNQKMFAPGESRLNLARLRVLDKLIKSRWPLLLARSITLAGFVFTILVGLLGSPVGSHNFAIIFVWIAWWTALKLFFIPLGGRSWCSVCPLPMPGEWLQNGSMLTKAQKPIGLGLRWPRRLRGNWLASGLFLLIGIFSALTLTDARLTAWILLGLLGTAMLLSLIFERRAFCSYVCPIGGFTGIYAKTAPLEVRVIDSDICKSHAEKTCYTHCPWGVYPLAMRDSSQCGLCMECLRVCTYDNISLNLRPFGSDLGQTNSITRLDETLLALVMLSSALSFSAVFIGPWGWLKSAAYDVGSTAWWAYTGAYLALSLLVLPGLYTLAVWWSQKTGQAKAPFKRLLADYSQALLPLGLFTWIAFTIDFAFPKFSYVLQVLSDPFGWGWNLVGTSGVSLPSALLGAAPVLQVGAVVVGLFWSANLSQRLVAKQVQPARARRAILPLAGFSLLFSLTMLLLLLG